MNLDLVALHILEFPKFSSSTNPQKPVQQNKVFTTIQAEDLILKPLISMTPSLLCHCPTTAANSFNIWKPTDAELPKISTTLSFVVKF
jgi:hypothetical protein